MLELRIRAGQPAIPLYDLSAALGRSEAARTVADQIEAMMALLDDLDGDCDYEEPNLEDSFIAHNPNGPGCPVSDAGDPAWIEWESRGRDKLVSHARDANGQTLHEDDEDDDPAEDDCEDRCGAGEDRIASDSVSAIWSNGHRHKAGSDDDAEDDDRIVA